jgi:hypothetical protein
VDYTVWDFQIQTDGTRAPINSPLFLIFCNRKVVSAWSLQAYLRLQITSSHGCPIYTPGATGPTSLAKHLRAEDGKHQVAAGSSKDRCLTRQHLYIYNLTSKLFACIYSLNDWRVIQILETNLILRETTSVASSNFHHHLQLIDNKDCFSLATTTSYPLLYKNY